jgi:hypothetical protein
MSVEAFSFLLHKNRNLLHWLHSIALVAFYYIGHSIAFSFGNTKLPTTDVITIDALKLFAKVVFCEAFLSSRRKYRGTGMFKTVSKPLAHLNFLSGVNCYDIGSIQNLTENTKRAPRSVRCLLRG